MRLSRCEHGCRQPRRTAVARILSTIVLLVALNESVGTADDSPLYSETFEGHAVGESILTAEQWRGFEGFRGDQKPAAIVKDSVGVEGSKALAITHPEPFRTNNWGVRTRLTSPIGDGVVWVQGQFKLPTELKSSLFFDMRGEKTNHIIARVAATPYKAKGSETEELRWHSVFNVPHWRLYTRTPKTDKWHTVTARIDYQTGTYACWADAQVLGDDLPLTSRQPLAHLYIGTVGTPDDPSLVDNLTVSRTPPQGFSDPDLLPKPDDDLIFRFAATGDPQLGFTSVGTDKARFAHATDQINRSGAELSLMLGDMIHFNDDLDAYVTMQELVKRFDKPYHYVRGNHEKPELFRKYFYRELHYSVVHKGLRFVIIDAEGNHVGMSDEQLDWIESEFQLAEKASEDIVIALHVSPWQNNERGTGKYNQIGKGRDRLRELMKEHKVLLSLSGHYHRALWHGHEEETHYLTLGGTALVKGGGVAWCAFDVYPDRVVMHQKPLFFEYEKAGVERIHTANDWLNYTDMKAKHPYTQQGPLTIKRHRPAL